MRNLKMMTPEELQNVSHITAMVNNLLSKKTLYERRRQDENSPTNLGGVTFFYRFIGELADGSFQNIILCWDTNPAQWDEDSIIKDIEYQESYIDKLTETGAAGGYNPSISNPFTY